MPGVTRFHRPGEADEALYRVQQELFDIGGECACSPGKLPEQMVLVGMKECDRLIDEMDDWIKELQPLKSFILPMGSAPCLLYTSPSPRDRQKSRMPSSA